MSDRWHCEPEEGGRGEDEESEREEGKEAIRIE